MSLALTAPDYVVLVVEALDRALAFYVDELGLRLGHRSGAYAQLDTGTTRLAFYERHAMSEILGEALEAPRVPTTHITVGFKVSDVDASYDTLLSAGAVGAVPPEDRVWGQRTAYVRDPDGHLVELVQQTDVRR